MKDDEITFTKEVEPDKIWLIRKAEKLSMWQWILLYILFVVSVQILNVTLDHFGIAPPFKERENTISNPK